MKSFYGRVGEQTCGTGLEVQLKFIVINKFGPTIYVLVSWGFPNKVL